MGVALDVVIVNWNSGTHLRTCLESLGGASALTTSLSVVVVDNASDDTSARQPMDSALPIQFIRNANNRGFAVACNQGARLGTSEFILFLNPDVVVTAESIIEPLRFMEAEGNERYAICGIRLLDPQNRTWRSCCRLPSLPSMLAEVSGLSRLTRGIVRGYSMTEWPHDESRDVDHVIGAFYLVRRTVFDGLGGFDERFFVYLEDLDFSRRVRDASHSIRFLATARAYHAGGGTSAQVKVTRLIYSIRSRIQYARKHFAPAAAVAVLLFSLVVEPLLRVGYGLIRGAPREVGDAFRAHAALLMDILRLHTRPRQQD